MAESSDAVAHQDDCSYVLLMQLGVGCLSAGVILTLFTCVLSFFNPGVATHLLLIPGLSFLASIACGVWYYVLTHEDD